MEQIGGRKVTWKSEGEIPKNIKALVDAEIETPANITYETLELRKYLKKLDFGLLKSILEEEYVRSGIDPKIINFFEAEKITGDLLIALGSYNAVENKIRLSMRNIKKSLEEELKDINPELVIAFILFHEEIHAVSRVECEYSKGREENPLIKVGYAVKKLFKNFNEGVCDLIALEVLKKYADRTHQFSDQDLEKFLERLKSLDDFDHHLAESFTSKLARISGMPRHTVWEAIKAGIFRGDDFYQEDLREYINSELGEQYIWNLSQGKITKTSHSKRTTSEQLGRNIKASILKL